MLKKLPDTSVLVSWVGSVICLVISGWSGLHHDIPFAILMMCWALWLKIQFLP